MASVLGKGSMPAPAVGSAGDIRPSETPKDLKKRVRGLDKSLTSVHERLVQTEKQIFDLERSYLEETRLYGNVLQGWDAYLDTKGEGKGNGDAAAGDRGGSKLEASDVEEGEGANKRTKGVELEERLFSLGSVTSPAAKSLQKLEEAKRRAESKNDGGGGGGGGGSGSGSGSGSGAPGGGAGAGAVPRTPKDKRSYTKRTTAGKSAKKESSKKKKR